MARASTTLSFGVERLRTEPLQSGQGRAGTVVAVVMGPGGAELALLDRFGALAKVGRLVDEVPSTGVLPRHTLQQAKEARNALEDAAETHRARVGRVEGERALPRAGVVAVALEPALEEDPLVPWEAQGYGDREL